MHLKDAIRKDLQEVMPLLGERLPQKFMTFRFRNFLEESGICGCLSDMKKFTRESAAELLRRNIGVDKADGVRTRMLEIIIDFLYECGCMDVKEGHYIWNDTDNGPMDMPGDELEKVRKYFSGQTDFIDRCINYAEEFMRGACPLFKFDGESVNEWEMFLGNAEFEVARMLLIKMLSVKKDEPCRLLNLCSGMGFDINMVQCFMPDAEVTAIDFTDAFHDRVSRRVKNSGNICWTDSRLWSGFGSPLPFDGQTFDLIFFSCADPYIPRDSRETVYRDIFRILKKGGSLGLLTNSYPDPDGIVVKDPWIRRGVLCHDFAESVCEGWNGFSLPRDSSELFRRVGYHVSSVLLNGSLWRLDRE